MCHLVVDVTEAIDCGGRLLSALSQGHVDQRMRGGSLMVGVQLPHLLAALPTASVDGMFSPKEIRSTSRAY